MATRKAPAKNNITGFVIKNSLPDGRVVWVDPQTLEEITLNQGTAPTEDLLHALAANGIVPRVPHLADEIGGDDFDSEPDDIPETALDRVLTSLKDAPENTRAEIRVYKIRDDGSEVYCGKCLPDEFESKGGLEWIRFHWGGGKFRVRVYGPSITEGSNYGKFVRLTNQLVEIERSSAPAVIPGAPVGASNPGDMSQMLDFIERRFQQMELSRVPVVGGDLMGQLEMFAKLKSIFGGKEKSLIDQIQELEAVKKFREELTGGESGGGEKPDMMTMGLKLMDLIAANSGNRAQSVAGIPPLNPPAVFQPHAMDTGSVTPHIQPAPEPANNETSNDNSMLEQLGPLLSALIVSAKRGDETNQSAEFLATNLPDEGLTLLETPIWFETLQNAFPDKAADFETCKPWFTKLRDEIIKLAYEDGPG